MKLAIQLGLLNIPIRTASLYVFNCLNRGQKPAWKHKRIMTEIRQLHRHFEQVVLCFVFRESNGVADVLAKYGSGVQFEDGNMSRYSQIANPILQSVVVWDECPPWLFAYVCKDLSLITLRFVSPNSTICTVFFFFLSFKKKDIYFH